MPLWLFLPLFGYEKQGSVEIEASEQGAVVHKLSAFFFLLG